jgi:hypothetical protein
MPITDLLQVDSEPSGQPPAAARQPPGVAGLKRLRLEVCIGSPFGTFWLVPEPTGEDRLELTPEDVVHLSTIARLFGGRITSVTRDGKLLAGADPEAIRRIEPLAPEPQPWAMPTADAAREHLRRLKTDAATSSPPVEQTRLFDGKRGRR